MVGAIGFLFSTSIELGWIVLAFFPVVIAFVLLFAGPARSMFLAVQKRLDRLNTVLQENLAGVRVVKAFVREDHEIERFGEANEALTAQSIRVYRLLALLMPLMMVILNAAVIVALWFGGRLTVEGSMTVGEVVASVNYLSMALFPLMMLAGMVAPLAAADASASRILEVLDSEPDVRDRPGARALEAPHGRVAFEDVGFGYTADGGAPVLQGVSFVAEPGETVAILGATGSGKSTLIHLIPRFYDVTSGRVTLDGVDVRDLTLASLRSTIGIALQEAVLFSGTVRDNVRYGRPDATQAEIEAAAEAAQAAEFIAALPDGYDTVIGERGVTLSGGQRQRLAIARALVVRPKVLILDDSTSAVDIETEVRLQDAMDRLIAESARATTRFIVAQRISTVLLADKILVLDGGRIAASGTHADLLASNAVYREIYESQLGDGRGASEEAHRG
jgi:ATP-binding cassette subfamily B protein